MIDNRSLRELEQQNLLDRIRWIFVDFACEVENVCDKGGVGNRVILWLTARALNMAANPADCGDASISGFPQTGLDGDEEKALWGKSLQLLTDAFERISKFSRLTEEDMYLIGKLIEMLFDLGSRHFRRFYPPIEMEKCEKLYGGRSADPAPIEAVQKAFHFNTARD